MVVFLLSFLLGGPAIKLSIFFIQTSFLVLDPIHTLYDLRCQVWLENTTHNQSYGVQPSDLVFLISDGLVID
jgi:hypothetical protein